MIKVINEDGYHTLLTIYKNYKKIKAARQKNKVNTPNNDHHEFKKFAKSDWNTYPGAQKFSDGSEPLIFRSDNVSIVLSGDPSGAWVVLEYNGSKHYICERTFNRQSSAFTIANAIAAEINRNSNLSPDEFIDIVDSFGFELIR